MSVTMTSAAVMVSGLQDGDVYDYTAPSGDLIKVQRVGRTHNIYMNGMFLSEGTDYTIQGDTISLFGGQHTIKTSLSVSYESDPTEYMVVSDSEARVSLIGNLLALSTFQCLAEVDQEAVRKKFIENFGEIYHDEHTINLTKLKSMMQMATPFKFEEVINER